MSATCFPFATGVAGQSEGPNWYDNSLPRPFSNSLDDPRWRGAFSHTFGQGAGTHVIFKGLNVTESGKKLLLLSWNVQVGAPNITNKVDTLFLGFSSNPDPPVPNPPALIASIALATTTPTTPTASTSSAPAGVYTPEVFTRTTIWNKLPAVPLWVTQRTRVWVIPPASPTTVWAVQMAVPMDEDLSPTTPWKLSDNDTFRMWYAVYLGAPVSGDSGPVYEYFWPSTCGVGEQPDSGDYPNPTSFVECRAANSPSDPACTVEGISIGVMDIGTRNHPDFVGPPRTSSSEIHLDLVNDPPTVNPEHSNQFFAKPTFPPGTPDNRKGCLGAHFRIANWGSYVGDSPSWAYLPGQDIAGALFDVTKQECQFEWPPASGALSPDDLALIVGFRPGGGKMAHQCVLVELTSSWPSGETFINNSVYRNMDIVSASTFEREASIGIAGLAATPTGQRDVYLYVETRNMSDVLTLLPETWKWPIAWLFRKKMAMEQSETIDAEGKKQTELDIDVLAQRMPTYRVHVFYDTGRRTKLLGGGDRPILQPQTSFGYFIEHKGTLYGWQHFLTGTQKIGPNFYKLSVPDNGEARITTRIEAIDKPGCAWLLGILIGLIRKLLRLS